MNITLGIIKQSSIISVALVLCFGTWVGASAFPELKALPAAVEARWIQTVKQHRTKDGAAVSEVLAYAEKMRPREFKGAGFDAGYNGVTGSAETVTIGYWIGAKRSPDDAFVDLGYHMSPSRGHVVGS
jgi:hypothetical protein